MRAETGELTGGWPRGAQAEELPEFARAAARVTVMSPASLGYPLLVSIFM